MENNLKKFIADVREKCEYESAEALEWFLQQDQTEYNADFVEFKGNAKLCAKWYVNHVAYK